MRDNISIFYFTANRERPSFEEAIQRTILSHSGGLPILSISQKPTPFGHNVSIGDLGASPINLLRQLALGATLATTQYLILCESDGLYPPSYFSHLPTDEDTIYYPDSLYITWQGHSRYWPKRRRDISGIISRRKLLSISTTFLSDPNSYLNPAITEMAKQELFHVDAPVVTIVTADSMHYVQSANRPPLRELPLWGAATNLWETYK